MCFSDDTKNIKKYIDCIEECHRLADNHKKYCDENCMIKMEPHTNQCIAFREKHYESFVQCYSTYCLKKNSDEGLRPSYTREKKEEIYKELTYYSDEE
jgi:hypothetical protein